MGSHCTVYNFDTEGRSNFQCYTNTEATDMNSLRNTVVCGKNSLTD